MSKREQILPQVIEDMTKRIAKGEKEYGEPLTTENGRDMLQDAYEEVLDLAMYLKGFMLERKNLKEEKENLRQQVEDLMEEIHALKYA